MNTQKIGAWAQLITAAGTIAGVAIAPELALAVTTVGAALSTVLPSIFGVFKK